MTAQKTNSNAIGKAQMPRGRTADKQVKILIDKFIRMLPGQSFFIENALGSEVAFLRRPAKDAGCNIKIVQVEHDEIYCMAGVRVWRLEGEYDDLG